LIKVLGKPELSNAIKLSELETLMENFGLQADEAEGQDPEQETYSS